jgi:hypothetical protein
MLLARVLNNVSVVWYTTLSCYYSMQVKTCNPLRVFVVDTYMILKSWTFHCKTLSLIVPSKSKRNEMLSWL